MTRWYGKSIRNKLVAVVLLAIVPAFLLTSVAYVFREAHQQQSAQQRAFEGIATALAASTSEALASGDKLQVANALRGIGAIPGVEYVSVRDAAGRMVFQFDSGVLVGSSSSDKRAGLFNLKTYPAESEVRHAGQVIGRLLLIADISQVRAALLRNLLAAVLTALLALTAGLLASYRTQRAISTPIQQLMRAKAPQDKPFAGIRVLAADDCPLNREVLMEALHRLGAQVTCVEDGAAALAAIKSATFDIMFIDGSMPVLDGFEATRALRAWEAETGRTPMPVVGLSAHLPTGPFAQWRDCGMSAFIPKPFALSAIRDSVQQWVQAPSTEIAAPQTPAAMPPNASPLIDDAVLQSIAQMQRPGDDLLGRVTGLYIQHAPALLDKLLHWEMTPEDLPQLAAAAHALKSLSRNVGAVRVGDLCGLIEEAARDGRAELAAHRDALTTALAQTVDSLSAGVHAPAPAPGSAHTPAPRSVAAASRAQA